MKCHNTVPTCHLLLFVLVKASYTIKLGSWYCVYLAFTFSANTLQIYKVVVDWGCWKCS